MHAVNYSSLCDADLLLHVKWGSESQKKQASTALFNRYQRPVSYHIEQVFPSLRHCAEDIAQEVFIRFFASVDGIEAQGLRAWLRRVTYNRGVDWLRHFRRGAPMRSLDGMDENPLAAEEACHEDEIDIEDLLSTLPSPERDVWVLHVHEGRILREVAERFGWFTPEGKPDVNRVYRVLTRARDHLARLLEEQASD
jgi:RNA polymerase sigma factor (sigma-70 family)